MKARYGGTCILCHQPIREGDEIHWERGVGAAHVECDDAGGGHADPGTLPSERRRGRPEREGWS